MNLFALFFDNPLITKHVRARLRRGVLIPLVIVVVILSVLIVFGGLVASANFSVGRFGPRNPEMDRIPYMSALSMLLGLQGLVLLLGGTLALASSVANAREKGILDFHRISPQTPASMALGFLLGGPIREWLLFLLMLPFGLFLSLLAGVSPLQYAAILITQITTALFFHTLTLVVGLSKVSPRTTAAASVILVLAVHWVGSGLMAAGSWFPMLLTSVPVMMQMFVPARDLPPAFQPAPFFGVPLPMLVLTLIYQLPLLAFLFVMAVRKLRADRLHIFSKPLAVSFLLVSALLTTGSIWSAPGIPVLLVLLNVMTYVSLFLVANITPAWGEFVTGLRRAAKLGRTRQPPWTDEAANPPTVALVAVLLLLCGLTGWWLDQQHERFAEVDQRRAQPWRGLLDIRPSNPVLPMTVAVGWLIAFGCAAQYYQLIYGKGGTVAFRFFVFLAWMLPLLLCIVASMSRSSEAVTFLLALSPPAGLILTCLPDSPHWRGQVMGQYLAAGVAVATAGIFAVLLWHTLRRASRATERLQQASAPEAFEPLSRPRQVRGPLLAEADAPRDHPPTRSDSIRSRERP